MTSSRLPDFLIIGAMKSGTSTLQAQLLAQPGIFMTTPKEPNFFSDDSVYARGANWYRGLFDGAAPGDLKGEASTHYTKLPTYPATVARMAELLENPRFVYVIRDPVQRALSHYLHEWSRGAVGRDVTASFAEHPEFVSYGRYPMQLAPYLEWFGRDSLLLTSLEQLRADPEGELARIGTHVGISKHLAWDYSVGVQNASSERVRPLPLQGLIVDNPVARVLRRTLVPKTVRTRIRAARTRPDRPILPEGLRCRLEDTFRPDQDILAALFPEFAGLERSYPFTSSLSADQ